MSGIDPTILNECNLCRGSPHDTPHLFNCPANHTLLTVLTPLYLWIETITVAKFLKLTISGDEDIA